MGNKWRSELHFAFFVVLFFQNCGGERSVYRPFSIGGIGNDASSPDQPSEFADPPEVGSSPDRNFYSESNSNPTFPTGTRTVRGSNRIPGNQRGSNTNKWVPNRDFGGPKNVDNDRNKSDKKWSNNWNFGNKAPQTEGYGGMEFGAPPETNPGNQWTNDGNSNNRDAKPNRKNPGSGSVGGWMFGKEESQTEGLPEKPTGNQWNSNSNSWNTGSDSKKNQGSANWGYRPDTKTEGYGGLLPSSGTDWNPSWSSGSKPQKESEFDSSKTNAWNSNQTQKKPSLDSGNTNSWSSNQNQKKTGSENGNGNSWNSNQNQRKPALDDNNTNSWNSNQNQKKPGSENSNGNSWNSNQNQKERPSSKPGKFENTNINWNGNSNQDSSYGKKPSRPQSGTGNNGNWNEKPSALKPSPSSSNSNANSKPNKKVDWATIEKENKEGELTLDLSQLWLERRGNPQGRRGRKRHIPTAGPVNSICYCTDRGDCDEENRIDVMNVFEYDLSNKVAECAISNKVCCTENPSPPEKSFTKRNEITELGVQAINLRPSCGKRVSKLSAKEINEENLANYGSFPWILRMIALEGDGERTLCSSSLFHTNIALTTASCALLLSGKEVRARAGEWSLYSGHGNNNIQESRIGKIFLHPEFNFLNRTNDLALIFLEDGLDFSLNLNSVCLPSNDDAWDVSRCAVVGWTKQKEQGMGQSLLWQINLESITQGKCDDDINMQPNKNYLKTEDEPYICAHSRDVIPCVEDHGSSLMCPLYNSDIMIQIGFLHHGTTCKGSYRTATFTDILKSVGWISRIEGIYFLAKAGLI